MLWNLSEPGSLGALLIPTLMVSGWVLDRVYPLAKHRERKRAEKLRRYEVEVMKLWEDRQAAIDWLRLQGYTDGTATRLYDAATSRETPP